MKLENLKEKFEEIEILPVFRGEKSILVSKEKIHDVLKFLKESSEFKFEMLLDVTAVDYLGRAEDFRFEVVYHIYSLEFRERLRVKTRLKDGESIKSITDIYPSANWPEREVYDLFGIKFEGHPYLKRILLWEGFEGHPLRKDYPLRAEPPLPEPR